MRKLMTAATIVALCGSVPAFAQPGTNSPTLTHDNPSSCLGAERASRNSNGGDRQHGAFGQAQSDYVQYLNEGGTMTYGEFLQTWKDQCTYARGGGTDDSDDGE